MRAPATIIAILVLLLSGCGLEPQIKPSDKAQLENLKGPDVGSIDATLLSQAQEAEAAGDYTRAQETYKQLIDKSPNNKDYMLAFANDLRRSGDSAAALLLDDKLLKKDPGNPAVLESKALSLMGKGEFKDAGKMFEDVMKIDPKRWRTLNGIGILFAMKSRNKDALAYYNEALSVNPGSASVLNNMALTLAMDKQYDQAIETFMRAKHTLPVNSPDLRSIDLNLALVYAIAGKLDEAEHTAAPHVTKAGLYNNMGFYAYLAKNNDLAKGYLNMALTQSPVYYERAWKNLSAFGGENDDDSGKNEEHPQTPMYSGDHASHGLKTPPKADTKESGDDEDEPAKTPSKSKKARAPSDDKPVANKTTAKTDVGTKLDDIPAPKPAEPITSVEEPKVIKITPQKDSKEKLAVGDKEDKPKTATVEPKPAAKQEPGTKLGDIPQPKSTALPTAASGKDDDDTEKEEKPGKGQQNLD